MEQCEGDKRLQGVRAYLSSNGGGRQEAQVLPQAPPSSHISFANDQGHVRGMLVMRKGCAWIWLRLSPSQIVHLSGSLSQAGGSVVS